MKTLTPVQLVIKLLLVGILQIINANSKMGDMFLEQNDHCLECHYKKTTHSLQFEAPISFNKYEAKFKSVQTYFNNYLVNDTPIRCDLCLKASLLDSRRFKTEP